MMKKIFGLVMLAGALSLSGAAFAAGAGNGSNASPCGAAHGDFADVNGPPAIGQGGAPSLHGGATGQEPGATGFNNSHTACHDALPS
jgi:hypothetical protein